MMAPRFVSPGEHADCTVLVVTYNSGEDIDAAIASLRSEAANLALRVVIVDNDSTDDTRKRVLTHDDVELVDSGGNLGFAGGLNMGVGHIDPTDTVFVLNPDASVAPGALALLIAAAASPAVAATVPRLTNEDRSLSQSLRREPSVLRSLGDALFGSHWPSRPSWLGEIIYEDGCYSRSHDIEWATGAAVLVTRSAWKAAGQWDESFFLYSEETDYARRLRELPATIRYVPDAEVIHRGGGSGESESLVALMTVNRVRYAAKYHGPRGAAAMRAVLILQSMLRAHRHGQRLVLRTLLDKKSWDRLPGPTKRAG